MSSISRTSDLLIFTRQFGAMVRSNLQLVSALESLERDTPRGALRSALKDVLEKVRTGDDFDRALSDHPKIFDAAYVGVVRAGMQSGELGNALQQISDFLHNQATVIKKARSALMYPAVLAVSFVVTFHIMVFGVIPQFESLFSQFGSDLPVPTQFVVAVGHAYADNWKWALVCILTVGLAFFSWLRTPNGRINFDQAKLSIPLFGSLMRLMSMSRFAQALAIQVENSVTLIDAIRIAAPASGNQFIKRELMNIADDIERGAGISEAFERRNVFTGVMQQMISAGEQTGNLDEPFRSVAKYFDSIWAQRFEAVVAIANPALTVILGLLISGMLMAAFLPVFEMAGVPGQ
jgi:type IV pilus assembly protein PilC